MTDTSRPPRAVIFDIDGTLLPDTTVSLFMAERMGHLELIVEMDAALHAYEIDDQTFASRDAVNYRGVAVAEVEARLADLPLIAGLEEVCRRLTATGVLVAHSGGIRPVIPILSGHRFQSDPATDSGASGQSLGWGFRRR